MLVCYKTYLLIVDIDGYNKHSKLDLFSSNSGEILDTSDVSRQGGKAHLYCCKCGLALRLLASRKAS